MKLLIKPLLVALFSVLLLGACSEATLPKEGQQYISLATPLTDKSIAPVTEVFSLTCSHCRNMENFLEQISAQAGTAIGKLHTTFNQSADNAAQLYYAAELQLEEIPDHAFMEQLFAAVQMGKESSDAQRKEAIADVFTSRNLVSPYQLSKQQNDRLQQTMNQVRLLSAQSEVNAVPAFIVNGRYQVLVAGHDNPEQIANTISYLLKK